MYLLDTNILSNLMKKFPSNKLEGKINSVPSQDKFTSSITLGELIYGARKKKSDRLSRCIEKLVCEAMPILPFDAAAARLYGEIRTQLESRGSPIGDADTRIAAIALHRGLIVVTADSDFAKVPGLKTVNWLLMPGPEIGCG